ncbi:MULTISPECIES: ankyrin repeat domain-containing protein [Maribacter]|uniref:Ankyrin repeat-containing protein n=1 Tax=Maribacter stanieri TaxID=440514 RepID=A0A1I6KEY3_9FLAO|nr:MULTISPECIES: ankyrin repeat domain-containing protein [Maribacter]SFR89714.1 Ankyrin repeat-containing protein [Maribacter stanieri]|tara:strand:- start:13 stop:399 length:387 start_codon:yes stop_codon:yes gene_type:complete
MKKSISILLFISVFTLTGVYANNSNLINLNESISVSVNDEISSLCKAVMKGDIDQVRSLIAIGEELNEKSLGLTPAMYAARYNKAEVLKVLLLNGANLNIKSDQGYTAKEYAKMSNAKDVLSVINENS